MRAGHIWTQQLSLRLAVCMTRSILLQGSLVLSPEGEFQEEDITQVSTRLTQMGHRREGEYLHLGKGQKYRRRGVPMTRRGGNGM